MADYTRFRNGFEITTNAAIDKRIYLTKAEMIRESSASTAQFILPNVYLAICSDDGKFYLYNVNNTPTTETGKFKLIDEQVLSNTSLFETALTNSVKFTTLETKVGDAEKGTGLAGDVKVLKQDVTTLQTNVTTLQTEVADLKEEVEDPESGLAKRIQQLEGRLDDAEERMEEIEARIAAIKLDNIPGTISGGVVEA